MKDYLDQIFCVIQLKMKKKQEDVHISYLLQSFIYTMNEESVRNQLIQDSIRVSSSPHKCKWLGTWTIEYDKKKEMRIRSTQKSLIEFVKSLSFQSNTLYLFTVCFVYDGNRVHYVAFIYYPFLKKLVSFDPGVELYHHGQQTIVPHIRKVFYECEFLSNNVVNQQQNIGTCQEFSFCGKKWGIQYNANHVHSLPADAFCQTWTLFFLTRWILQLDPMDMSFVGNWCKIHPTRRELFLLSFFILPQLNCQSTLKKVYHQQLQLRNALDFKKVMLALVHYSEISSIQSWTHKIQCRH